MGMCIDCRMQCANPTFTNLGMSGCDDCNACDDDCSSQDDSCDEKPKETGKPENDYACPICDRMCNHAEVKCWWCGNDFPGTPWSRIPCLHT